MATHYKADGTTATVVPPDGRKAFTLAELQAFVGGYIETIPYYYHGARPSATRILLVNEEGRLRNLSVRVRSTASPTMSWPAMTEAAALIGMGG